MLGVSRRRLSIRYCLPDSSFLLSCSPETSSRVTLAALGIGFQPKLPTTENPQPTIHNRQPITNYRRNKVCLEDNTEQSESNPGRSLGIINKEGTAVWKTVPTNNRQPITNYRRNKVCLEDNTEQSESNPGQSPGIINKEGTAVWKTVPTNNRQPITKSTILNLQHLSNIQSLSYPLFAIP